MNVSPILPEMKVLILDSPRPQPCLPHPELKEEDTQKQEIKCCYDTCSKGSLDYNVKIIFLSFITLFSMTGLVYMELYGDKCSNLLPVLTSLLTGVLGILVPKPKRKS